MAELSMDRTAGASSLDERLAAHRAVAWQHGIIGGLTGAVVMGVFLVLAMGLSGYGYLRPFELIGSVWYGTFTTGAAVIVVGMVTHLAVAALFGVVWAFLFSYVKVEPVISGLVYGALLWVLMQFLVLPIAGFLLGKTTDFQIYFSDFGMSKVLGLGTTQGFSLWMVLGAYLLFGLSLGAFEEWADRRRATPIDRV